MRFDCAANHVALAVSPICIKAGSSAGDNGDWLLRKQARDRARGSRISDAHLADCDKVFTLRGCGLCQSNSDVEGRSEFFLGHCRLTAHIAASTSNLHAAEAGRVVEVSGDAHIDDDECNVVLPRQYVDGRATAEKIEHHLRGYFGRIGTNAFCNYTVIGSKHVDRATERQTNLARKDAIHLRRDLFEPAETADRLSQRVEFVLSFHRIFRVERANGREHVGELRGGVSHGRSLPSGAGWILDGESSIVEDNRK